MNKALIKPQPVEFILTDYLEVRLEKSSVLELVIIRVLHLEAMSLEDIVLTQQPIKQKEPIET